MRILVLVLSCLGLFGPTHALAQSALESGAPQVLDLKPTDVIFWESVSGTVSGNHVQVGVRLRTEGGFALYQEQVTFEAPAGYTLKDQETPPTRQIVDPVSGENVQVYDGGDFLLTFEGLEPFTGKTFELAVTYLGCTERICLFPYTDHVKVPVFAATGGFAEPAFSAAASGIAAQKEAETTERKGVSADDWQQEIAGQLSRGELSLGWLLVILFLGGLATNLTPCVFPMIPITVRILAREAHSPVKGALLYALGVVLSYSILGLVVSLTGGLFGALVASTGFNLFFVALFILLGFGMLGYGNLSALQQLGAKLGSNARGGSSVILMGMGAGLVAAPCTGPILGALIAFTAKHPELAKTAFWQFFVYSAGFALPYVFLGIAAQRVASFRMSPLIQEAVKLVFAAIMFALALYYLRIPLYAFTKNLEPYWAPMAWIGLGLGAALMIAVLARGGGMRKGLELIPVVILAVGLASGLQAITKNDGGSAIELTWHKNTEEGLAAAQQSGKPILLDGWAEWCEACKRMDATTFQDSDVRRELQEKWELVKLDLTELNEANEEIAATYGMQGLPTLVLLPPDGDLGKMKKITGYASAEHLLRELKAFGER